jgi:putative restriction endonuclease
LQPNQGAYLTYLDEQLFDLLIPIVDPTRMSTLSPLFSSQPQKQVQTSESIRNVRIREGQNRFSLNVRKNYNFQCCFPDCNIKEARFLTGSHIARWADHPELRGNASNGLCLCLMHDKAFEIGYFTINIQNQVVLNKKNQAARKSDWYKQALQPFDRQFITIPLGAIPPSTEALAQHWARIDFIP